MKLTRPSYLFRFVYFVLVASLLLPLQAESETYKATIYRDAFGVPHIVAESLEAVAFGDGYAQAEDRLGLVLENIQSANGTRAAVMGSAFVERDFASRVTGARHYAYANWDKVSPRMRGVLTAFAAGVNKFQADHPEKLPPNAQTIEPQEVLACLQYMILARQFGQSRKDAAGQGEVPISGEGEMDDSEGSNGWVLAPSRSVSGHPIIVCDPHTPWNGMNRWYEKHYLIPEGNIYGAGSTGTPLFLFAATDKISWTMTRNSGDRGDCFEVNLNPQDQNQYLLDGKPVAFKKRTEVIEVRGQKEERREVLETVHGPVFRLRGGKAQAAGMSLYGAPVSGDALIVMALASNLEDFRAGLALRELDGSQVFAADVKGNIFFGWLGRIMVRSGELNWSRAIDGSSSESLYQGILPFEQMPQSLNHSSGYYQGSNTANWTLKGGAWGLQPEAFPEWVRGFRAIHQYLPSRPQRLVDLIESRPRHSLDQVKEIALDRRVVAAEWAMPVIRKAVEAWGKTITPEQSQAVQILSEWVAAGPDAGVNSKGYTIYRELCEHLKRFNFNNFKNLEFEKLPERTQRAALKEVYSALSAAVENLLKYRGSVSVEWGDLNVIELADGRTFQCGVGDGTTQTIWQGTQARRGDDGVWRVGGGSDFMMITELGSPPRVQTLVPYGQSDDPHSKHFADQTPRWVAGEWKSVPFQLEAVKKAAGSSVKGVSSQ